MDLKYSWIVYGMSLNYYDVEIEFERVTYMQKEEEM